MSKVDTKLNTFLAQYPVESYQPLQTLVRAGSHNESFFYIETGAVRMTQVSEDGKNLILHIFFPGSTFSLLSLINHGINKYDYITQVTTTVRKVPQAEFLNFLKLHNDVLFELQLRLLKGLDGLLGRIAQFSLRPAYNQVASLLVYFSGHFAQPSTSNSASKQLTIKITHQEISEWLGLSRENVSIQMKKLDRLGLITTKNHLIKIVNLKELKKVAENTLVL